MLHDESPVHDTAAVATAWAAVLADTPCLEGAEVPVGGDATLAASARQVMVTMPCPPESPFGSRERASSCSVSPESVSIDAVTQLPVELFEAMWEAGRHAETRGQHRQEHSPRGGLRLVRMNSGASLDGCKERARSISGTASVTCRPPLPPVPRRRESSATESGRRARTATSGTSRSPVPEGRRVSDQTISAASSARIPPSPVPPRLRHSPRHGTLPRMPGQSKVQSSPPHSRPASPAPSRAQSRAPSPVPGRNQSRTASPAPARGTPPSQRSSGSPTPGAPLGAKAGDNNTSGSGFRRQTQDRASSPWCSVTVAATSLASQRQTSRDRSPKPQGFSTPRAPSRMASRREESKKPEEARKYACATPPRPCGSSIVSPRGQRHQGHRRAVGCCATAGRRHRQ